MAKFTSQYLKQLWQNPAYRAHMKITHMGLKHTEETKHKLSILKQGNKSRTGMVNCPLTRAKISQSLHGNKCGLENKSRLGQKRSIKECLKQSLTRLGKPLSLKHREAIRLSKMGNKNPSWLGGKSFEPYTVEFTKQLKELIRIRDAYTCQLCGMPECENNRELTTHHINYIKADSLATNLISLCSRCSSKVNFNREYWINYFRQLLNKRQVDPRTLHWQKTHGDLSLKGIKIS